MDLYMNDLPRKILFVISKTSFLEGVGGHWRSLRCIASELHELGHDVTVCTLTNGSESPVLQDCQFNTKVFPCSLLYLPKHTKLLKEFVNNIQPDIIHIFDQRSLVRAVAFPFLKNQPTVFTKTGGPVLKYKVTTPSDVTLFSQEDVSWFKERITNRTRYHLIPNRATPIVPDYAKVTKIKSELENAFVFLRICRIGEEYKAGIVKSIQLIKGLKHRNIITSLVIVGSIECQSTYQKLVSEYSDDVKFYTTKEFYEEGSQILPIANAVIAVGRGVQEAMSLGIPVLCPGSNNKFPTLITNDELFNQAMKFNFSQRTVFPENYDEDNLKSLISIIQNEDKYQELSKLSLFWFDEYFNVKGAVSKLQHVYNQCTPFHFSNLDTMAAILREIRITIIHSLIKLKRKYF
jgi:glycosyltransferase involved in cell wall biosynthesis